MNMQSHPRVDDIAEARKTGLLKMGLDALNDFAEHSASIEAALDTIRGMGDENAIKRCERLKRQLQVFEPSVTMIGQIKSGKTTLVNAMVGQNDLLPADVNPWTSVVTSLHLYPRRAGFKNSASFRFFDEDEWDKLVSGGGRIGELASRAGADDELEKIKRQVAEMREKSRRRLGRKFEVLLGQQRDYGYFDKDLIERYVCLGDDFIDEDGDADISDDQGQFADITKSADLHLERAALPMRLCVRDTPGVNDTFMMREQITIRAIRDSKMCVVVLSAHQALSSTDLALIRLVAQVKSRDVIIFVNRIDELSDPVTQVPQIADSIRATLERHKGPVDAEVIFGSALWASCAYEDSLDSLPPSSLNALENWAEQAQSVGTGGYDPVQRAWMLSGLPALQAAIAQGIVNGTGAALLQRVSASALNLGHGIAAASRMGAPGQANEAGRTLDSAAAAARASEITKRETDAFRAEFDAILADFAERLDRVQASFLDRATASLVHHLDTHGDTTPWTYDPAGLRVLLNSSHKVLTRKSQGAFAKAAERAAAAYGEVYAQSLALGSDPVHVTLPKAPQVPSPVSLGQTIALDLQGNWWKRWWMQKRGYAAYAAEFHDLIKSETNPVVEDLRDDLARGVQEAACTAFEAFLVEQESIFASLNRMRDADPDEVAAFLAKAARSENRDLLTGALETLSEYASS